MRDENEATTADEATPKYAENTRDNAGKNAGNTPGRPFAKGNPGRPKGAKNKATLLVEALLSGDAEQITRALARRAALGDIAAIKLCLERLVPRLRERTLDVDLPVIATAEDAARAAGQLVALVGAGQITPGEGKTLAGIIATQRQVIAARDVERRIVALEQAVEYLRYQVSEDATAADDGPAATDSALSQGASC